MLLSFFVQAGNASLVVFFPARPNQLCVTFFFALVELDETYEYTDGMALAKNYLMSFWIHHTYILKAWNPWSLKKCINTNVQKLWKECQLCPKWDGFPFPGFKLANRNNCKWFSFLIWTNFQVNKSGTPALVTYAANSNTSYRNAYHWCFSIIAQVNTRYYNQYN